MTRETSIEAYHKIEAEGLLSRRRWEVYDFVYKHGPVIVRDAWKSIAPGTSTGSISTRFSELERMGVLKEVGQQLDESTGMTVILWDVTENLPREIEKEKIPATKIELINALCEQIEAIIPRIKTNSAAGVEWMLKTKAVLKQCEKYRKYKN
jgi:hypothetical protein